MKRIIVLVLAVALLLTACSAKSKTKWPMSKQHEKYGRKALEIADQYLDYDLTAEEAYKKIDALCDSEGTLPEPKDSDEKFGDDIVKISVSNLRYEIRSAYYDKEADGVLDQRNDLAELLGEKSR